MAKNTDTPFAVALLKANRKHHDKNVRLYGKLMKQKTNSVNKWAKNQYNKSVKFLADIELAIEKLTLY